MTSPEEKFTQKTVELFEQYKPRMERLLQEIGRLLQEATTDYPTDVYDVDDNTVWLTVYVSEETGNESDNVDVRLYLADSLSYEGTLEGVNFALEAVSFAGERIAGMIPYNYTEQVWAPINDLDEIKRRFLLFEEGADPMELAELICEFITENQGQ